MPRLLRRGLIDVMKRVRAFLIYFLTFLSGGLFAAAIFYFTVNFIRDNEPLGYRLKYDFNKVAYSRYVDKPDKFSFLFTNDYDLDASTESAKKYGRDYLVGFKARDDSRIGCEVRKRPLKMDLSRDDTLLTQEMTALFGQGVLGFKPISSGQVLLNSGLPAFQFNFNFTDPLRATASINQIMVPKGDQVYLLMCGAGKAYFSKFASDFAVFFNSFQFEK